MSTDSETNCDRHFLHLCKSCLDYSSGHTECRKRSDDMSLKYKHLARSLWS